MQDSLAVNHAPNSVQDINHTIDILKWPLLIFIMFLIIRKPIIAFVSSITKITHGTTSVEAHQQKAIEKQEQKKISAVDNALGLFRHETIRFVQEAVLNESDFKSLNTDSQRIERLTNYSIALYITRHFESIYNSIFGSQILILQHLNSNTANEDFGSLKRHYDYAINQNPEFFEGYKYSEYLDFLFNYSLITVLNGQITITILGIDFLKFLTETGKNFNKPY